MTLAPSPRARRLQLHLQRAAILAAVLAVGLLAMSVEALAAAAPLLLVVLAVALWAAVWVVFRRT